MLPQHVVFPGGGNKYLAYFIYLFVVYSPRSRLLLYSSIYKYFLVGYYYFIKIYLPRKL